MVKYIKTEKTPKQEWRATDETARLEALGTPEALDRVELLRRCEVAVHRMGGFGRWIAKKDSERDLPPK